MASYRARGATDSNPLWTPNWFDPLGRDRVRRDEPPAPEVVVERDGKTVTLITKNNP